MAKTKKYKQPKNGNLRALMIQTPGLMRRLDAAREESERGETITLGEFDRKLAELANK